MSKINIIGLTFCYDGSYDDVFTDVSFSIDTDWRLGFTGRNGRGKTTFMKLLMGEYEYKGSITASVHFDYFPFPVKDRELDTIDVIMDIIGNDSSVLWKIKRELSLLEMYDDVLYRPFSTLSNGEQTKVLLAALFLKENNFLLIDEPTNHLDMHGRELVSEYLRQKSGFILVSHDRAFLDGCIDHILSINKANIEVQKGNFSSWLQNKALQDKFEQDENEKLQHDISHLSAAMRRTAGWSDKIEAGKIGEHALDRGAIGAQSARMMKRAKSIEKRRERTINEKTQLLKNIERADNLAIWPLRHVKDRLIMLENVSVNYGGRDIIRDLKLEVMQGERVALCGRNGCGKSSILKLIAGEDIPCKGSVRLASGLVISYMPQDTSFLQGDLIEFAKKYGIDQTLFLTILRKLDFPRVQFEKDMRDYSAGQRKKVLIAKSLSEHAHIYIWDEPLNYIDVLSRIQIEELLLNYDPTMLFVEHDSAFAERVATRSIYLHGSED